MLCSPSLFTFRHPEIRSHRTTLHPAGETCTYVAITRKYTQNSFLLPTFASFRLRGIVRGLPVHRNPRLGPGRWRVLSGRPKPRELALSRAGVSSRPEPRRGHGKPSTLKSTRYLFLFRSAAVPAKYSLANIVCQTTLHRSPSSIFICAAERLVVDMQEVGQC